MAAVGLVNVATDYTGTPNLLPMLFRTGDRIEASFPLRVASVAMAAEPVFEEGSLTLGNRSIKTDLGQRLPIAYYGPRGTIETISAAAVLNGQLARESIEDRIVVIGSTVTGSGDVFPTPFDPVLPGVEVISTAILHLVAGDGEVRNREVRLADIGLAVLLPMIVVGLLAWRRSAVALAAIAAVAIIWLVANLVSFSHGIWLGVALPIAATVPPAILFGSAQIWQGRRRAQQFAQQTQLLQRFQSPGLGDWLKKHPDFLTEPVRQDAAIVFIDLSGFTRLSQTSGPTAVRELLDAFYKLVEQEVDANQGVITNFMGDGAMIVFGLPEPSANDASNAARCCTALADARSRMAGLASSIGRDAGRRKAWRAFRPDRRFAAGRRQPAADHGDRRYGERSKPFDGGGSRARRRARAQRRPVPGRGWRSGGVRVGEAQRTGQVAHPRPHRHPAGLALAIAHAWMRRPGWCAEPRARLAIAQKRSPPKSFGGLLLSASVRGRKRWPSRQGREEKPCRNL